jgi:RHS repeat-associated protein
VFGLDRLSVELKAYTPGDPMEPQTGDIAADIAVNDARFIIYHQDRLGSTTYTTRENGDVFTHSNYDAWGKPLRLAPLAQDKGVTATQTAHDINRGGIGWTTAFTGHDYDAVLEVYFAQARLYDPNTRRFTAVDAVKGSLANPATMVQYTYVLNNPLLYVDPLGLFLQGTVLQIGANGDDVIDLTKALRNKGYISDNDFSLIAPAYGTYTQPLANVVEKYINSFLYRSGNMTADEKFVYNKALNKDYSMDQYVWRALGLPINNTLAEEFWSGTIKNDILRMTLTGDKLTIEYFPKFYVQESSIVQRTGTFGEPMDVQEIKQASSEVYTDYVNRAVAGFMQWSTDGKTIDVQGRPLVVEVIVTPSQAAKKKQSRHRYYRL